MPAAATTRLTKIAVIAMCLAEINGDVTRCRLLVGCTQTDWSYDCCVARL